MSFADNCDEFNTEVPTYIMIGTPLTLGNREGKVFSYQVDLLQSTRKLFTIVPV